MSFSAERMSKTMPITCTLRSFRSHTGAIGVWLILLGVLVMPSPPGRSAELDAAAKPPDLTELPLESLMQIDVPKISSASKFEQKITEAPASITVVLSDDIKHYGYRTLADVLESVQGFQVSYDRNYSFLGVRGINLGDFNSRVLLLVDGHRVNNNLTDGAAIGNEFILDVDLIDRVEIVRGPGSILYGNNAFFGVINVVTRRAKQLNGFEVSGEYGAFETFKGRISYGKSFTNGIELLLSGTYYDSGGADRLFFPAYATPDNNNGVAENRDGERYGNVFGSLGYQDFSLEGAFIHRDKRNPTAQFFTTFNDPRLETMDERGYVNLKYAHSFENVLDVTAQLYYDRNDFDIGYPFGTAFYKEVQTGEWWGTEVQLSKRLADKHTIILGGEYRNDFRQDQRVFDPSTGQVFTDNHRTRESHGVFTEGDFALLDNLHFNGGFRYDQYGDFDPAFNPRLALIYNPVKESTLKAVYGTAFRAPNFLELSDPRFQNITPEEITSYELIYEQDIGANLRSSLTGFWNQMDHLIALFNGSFENFDAESKGVELALEGNWLGGLRGRASYTFQQTENRSQNQPLPDSPEHLVKFNLTVPVIKEKLLAGLEVQYCSRRSTLFTTTTGATLPGTDVSGFSVVNFTLFSQKIVKNLEASASIYNLFNERYADPATRFHLQDQIPQDGRSFRVKLTYRF
jgi:iron complex outermembrane receptor protein